MRAYICVQLLLLGCVGYISCWSYQQEKNVCEYMATKSSMAYSKVPVQGQYGYMSYQWLPRKQPMMHKKRTCCPGWGSYVKNYGCWEKLKCQVSLPHKTTAECKADRMKRLEAERIFYKYTVTKSPSDPNLAVGELAIPLLDQPRSAVIAKLMTDELEAHWFNNYFSYLLPQVQRMTGAANTTFGIEQFDSYSGFLDVANFYNQQVNALKDSNPRAYWYRNDPSKVLDVFSNDKWMEDKYFTMKRLIFYPNSLRRVTLFGDVAHNFFALKAQLNPIFDWDTAIKGVTGMNFYMSVFYGLVYVVDHSILNGILHMDDITDRDPTDERVLRGPFNPIAIFAVARDPTTGECELKVVAIQQDRQTTSQVLTPSDGDRWLLMKMLFETTDFVIHQIGYHLTEHHFTMERICISMHRHLDIHHPLRQSLQRHCIGTHGVNSNGLISLFADEFFSHKLFGIGNTGAITVVNRVHKNLKWKDLDFMERMKKAGTLDHKLFPYHPYRDDGALIYDVARAMASDYIDVYYKTDIDVASDTELQSFANELSLQGVGGPEAAAGKIDGFPNSVATKDVLKGILKQIVWIVAEHSEAGYVLADMSIFMPFAPTKLYKEPPQVLTPLQSLGDSYLATFMGSSVTVLTTLHYDVLFDYGKFIVDPKGRAVIDRYHTRLMEITRPIIEKRNVDRLAKQQFSYPYFLPGFMPNGISI